MKMNNCTISTVHSCSVLQLLLHSIVLRLYLQSNNAYLRVSLMLCRIVCLQIWLNKLYETMRLNESESQSFCFSLTSTYLCTQVFHICVCLMNIQTYFSVNLKYWTISWTFIHIKYIIMPNNQFTNNPKWFYFQKCRTFHVHIFGCLVRKKHSRAYSFSSLHLRSFDFEHRLFERQVSDSLFSHSLKMCSSFSILRVRCSVFGIHVALIFVYLLLLEHWLLLHHHQATSFFFLLSLNMAQFACSLDFWALFGQIKHNLALSSFVIILPIRFDFLLLFSMWTTWFSIGWI